MPGVAHHVFTRMFVPMVIAGIWAYAHFERVRPQQITSMWREGNVMRVGNPYTTPIRPQPMDRAGTGAGGRNDEDDDLEDAWVANSAG
jgi:hypothetical protein